MNPAGRKPAAGYTTEDRRKLPAIESVLEGAVDTAVALGRKLGLGKEGREYSTDLLL